MGEHKVRPYGGCTMTTGPITAVKDQTVDRYEK